MKYIIRLFIKHQHSILCGKIAIKLVGFKSTSWCGSINDKGLIGFLWYICAKYLRFLKYICPHEFNDINCIKRVCCRYCGIELKEYKYFKKT